MSELGRGRGTGWHPPALHAPYRSTRRRAPNHAPLQIMPTPSEITGPVFGPGTVTAKDADLITNFAAKGEMALGPRILVHGRVMDEAGRPIPNALLEVWQANAAGRYRHKNDSYLAPLDPNFSGCGRCMTDAKGRYRFTTIQPGAYPWPNGPNAWRPAHIHFSIFGHSFTQRLMTQMYFEGDPLIWLCPIVGAIPQKAGITQLIAKLDMDAALSMDSLAYRFDIVLRGPHQTHFENRPEGM